MRQEETSRRFHSQARERKAASLRREKLTDSRKLLFPHGYRKL